MLVAVPSNRRESGGLERERATKIALAICADFANPSHAEAASAQQAEVYIASALISEAGYEVDA